jgi:MFS family permease
MSHEPSAPGAEPKNPPAAVAPASFLGRFTVVFGAVRELWIVFVLTILSNLAYRLVNFTLSLWLSSDLGFSDEKTGLAVMIWSAGLTLSIVLVGSLTDALGLRKTFLLGFALCIISRVFLTFTTVKWVALSGGMALLALGEGMCAPVTVAALRRYTTTAQRSIAYSLFYAIMNGGFFIALYISDGLRAGMGEHGRFVVPGLGMELSTYRTTLLASLALAVPSLVITYFWLREGVEATDQGVVITPERPKYPGLNMLQALSLTVRDTLRDTGRIFMGLWQQPGFYKFLAFLSFAAFIKMIFLHMDYTYPKFGIRELGEGSPIGHLYALNSILIVFLAPLVGVMTQKFPAYRMVIFGSFVAASSVFIMTIPPQRFQRLADGRLGHAIANAWLGGYSQVSPDDFHDLPTFARKLSGDSNAVSRFLQDSFSPITRSLLSRQLAAGFRDQSVYPHPTTALVSSADIKDVSAFLNRLQADPNPATKPISQHLWEQFSSESKSKFGDSAPDAQTRRAATLARELNRVLQGGALCDKQQKGRFAGMSLSRATHLIAESDPTSANAARVTQSQLLNRLLVEDAYPDFIEKSDCPLRVALAEDLTRIMSGPSVYEKQRFASVPLSGETKQRLAQDVQHAGPVRLNRCLLEDAFPSELQQNRVGTPGSVNPWYVMIFLFVVLLSVGEAFYSPRLYEYTAAIAPKGQEASYMAMSSLPFFLAKLGVAPVSGVLLAHFCPDTGLRHSGTLWMIIGFSTMIAPLGLFMFQRFIRVHEAGRDD